jgi:hypothetical protein
MNAPREVPDTFNTHLFVPLGRRNLPLARVLQHASSLVGSLLVLGYLARRYRHLHPTPGGSWGAFLAVRVPTLTGAGVGLACRLARFQDMGHLEGQLWWAFWPSTTGALLGLSLGCALVAWLPRCSLHAECPPERGRCQQTRFPLYFQGFTVTPRVL